MLHDTKTGGVYRLEQAPVKTDRLTTESLDYALSRAKTVSS